MRRAVRTRRLVALAGLGTAALAPAVLATGAPAAPVTVESMSMAVEVDHDGHDLLSVAAKGCIGFGPELEWTRTRATKPFRHTVTFSGTLTFATGKLDVGARTGTIAGANAVMAAGTPGHDPIAIGDIGIELSHGTAYVIGSVGKGPTNRSRKPVRKRLIRIAPYTLRQSPLVGLHTHKPISDSLAIELSGHATLAAGLAGPLDRLRCHRGRSPALRAGLPIGTVTAQMFPDGAALTSGTVTLVNAAAITEDDSRPIAFGAVAPATVAPSGTSQSLTFPTTAGTTLALQCDAGARCVPAGGHANLAGGFTMTSGGVTETISGLTLAIGGSPAVPADMLAGTLNGTPVTLTTDDTLNLGADVAADLSKAFGQTVDGTLGRLTVQSTSLQAP